MSDTNTIIVTEGVTLAAVHVESVNTVFMPALAHIAFKMIYLGQRDGTETMK